ncbi:MAG: AAA family ATPase, partial [Spirochaetia bacterium]|nr:AAA family ATPase [Spirochaetia bacterium]
AGTAKEYFLGENIKREYELYDLIETELKSLFDDMLISNINSKFKITAKFSPLIKKIIDPQVKKYVEALANKQDKGRKQDKEEFINYIKNIKKISLEEYNQDELQFLLVDYSKSEESILKKIEDLIIDSIEKDHDYRKIEETDDAIKILDKYQYKKECIVCDTPIVPTELIEKKKVNKENLYESLSESTKAILESILKKIDNDDPLMIRDAFLLAIKDGNTAPLHSLKDKVSELFTYFNGELNNLFADCSTENDIITHTSEYAEILKSKPEINEEDLKYIEEIVNENIDRKIIIDRDKNNNLKVFIDKTELLGSSRDVLMLSTGEQNFISLSFELLKARNTNDKIIVIDDPISSFDSIYKNKIAYSLIKVLNGKQQIILTHNTDLIRLLEHQRPGSFTLYLLNKTIGEINGFIPISKKEIDLLLRIDRLIRLLKGPIQSSIKNEKLFILSMIPFMRGYASIAGNDAVYDKLTFVMHGYLDNKVNITEIYSELFGDSVKFSSNIVVSADDISELLLASSEILNKDDYPLLDRTLNHSLMYLFLRLNVEKVIVNKYKVDTTKNYMLADIILAAFKGDTSESLKHRVFLTSKKTLLNEFNHFEGNMNIFQPAIDISDTALEKERKSIIDFIARL